jgi:hypothetical protein
VLVALKEMTMSLAFQNDDTKEYATRTEVHYMLRIPMYAIARAIREGKLEMHLIDGKIQVNVAEAKVLFGRNRSDLFA